MNRGSKQRYDQYLATKCFWWKGERRCATTFGCQHKCPLSQHPPFLYSRSCRYIALSDSCGSDDLDLGQPSQAKFVDCHPPVDGLWPWEGIICLDEDYFGFRTKDISKYASFEIVANLRHLTFLFTNIPLFTSHVSLSLCDKGVHSCQGWVAIWSISPPPLLSIFISRFRILLWIYLQLFRSRLKCFSTRFHSVP